MIAEVLTVGAGLGLMSLGVCKGVSHTRALLFTARTIEEARPHAEWAFNWIALMAWSGSLLFLATETARTAAIIFSVLAVGAVITGEIVDWLLVRTIKRQQAPKNEQEQS